MKFLRNRRRLAAFGAVASAVVGVTLFMVLPALGSTAALAGDASLAGVVPTDVGIGGNGNCSSIFPSGLGASVSEYDNNNPKTSPTNKPYASGNNDDVTFGLTLGGTKQKPTLDFTSTGAAVLGVGVNGGTDTDAFDYTRAQSVPNGFVAADQGLHAPAQSSSQYYSISHLTICYVLSATVSGRVYEDKSQPADGVYNSGDSVQSNWAVTVYDNGQQVGSGTSGSDGNYTVTFRWNSGDTYTVCEAPPSGDSTPWAQSQPNGSGLASCSGANLPLGYTLPSQSSRTYTGKDFGNVQGTLQSCATSSTGDSTLESDDGSYTIQTALCKGSVPFVLYTNTTSNTIADVWTGGGGSSVPMVERITWPYSSTAQNQVKVKYTDIFPFSASNLHDMRYCQLDPRTGGSDSLTLAPSYTSAGAAPSILQPKDPTNDPESSSCLISVSTFFDPDSPTGKYFQAYVYSLVDGARQPG